MNIEQFEQELREARASFYKYPEPVMGYFHWTGGHRYTSFDDYHFCVDGDGDIIYPLPLTEIPRATWKRNKGSIAIALCGCYGATAYRNNDGSLYARLGDEAPTEAQIETLAQMMAKISDVFDIPLTTDHFLTHAEVAVMDNYDLDSNDPDKRWDLAILHDDDTWMSGGEILRGKAIWYQNND